MVNTQIKKLAGFGVLFALMVVSVGAYTRLADAGLGCPDWPGCYGFLTVPDQVEEVELAETRYPGAPVEFVKAWWEMGHRYIAGALLVLVFSMLVMAYRGREREDTPPSPGVCADGDYSLSGSIWRMDSDPETLASGRDGASVGRVHHT